MAVGTLESGCNQGWSLGPKYGRSFFWVVFSFIFFCLTG